ncbi:hypothetical protein ACH4TX_42280 [Streptomyces sp. NPDC021098]|uniref:hypothetical protein n=1 Tax=unclassified Streptomyces TaxID=2593676 RepID=UPI0037B97F0C
MTAEAEPELPGVEAYTAQLEDAHRASAWPGIQPPDQLAASSSTAHDPTADLRERILRILQP